MFGILDYLIPTQVKFEGQGYMPNFMITCKT